MPRGRKRRIIHSDEPSQKPTPERLAKPDAPERTPGGFFKPPLLTKLRDKQWLDPNPWVRHAMHAAAEQLVRLYTDAGLCGSVGSINLDRVTCDASDPSHMMPRSGRAAEARVEFRKACQIMGWHLHDPRKGAGRVTVALLCEESSFEDVARSYLLVGGIDSRRQQLRDKLREGLFALMIFWRIQQPKAEIRVSITR